MKDSELINRVKKEIKLLEIELKESAAQLGGVFYDSKSSLNGSETINILDELENKIPEIKSKLDSLKGFNLSISESEEKIKESQEKIKELEVKIGSVLEKVGVELYCFIGDKELAYPRINTVYSELKEGELKSETLENKLYKYENNSVKKGVLDIFSKPFKVKNIKREITQNNKESLKKFRELGRVYSEIPQLIDEESNESILDILEEYKSINKSLKLNNDNIKSLNRRIADNEEKIKANSKGVKLKSVYSNFEQEIASTQNLISEKLIDLGFELSTRSDLGALSTEIQVKLDHFNSKKLELTKREESLNFLEKRQSQVLLLKEITDRENSINIEAEHIKTLSENLEKEKDELKRLKEESDSMNSWLEEHHLDF